MALLDGGVQGGVAAAVRRVHVGARAHQELDAVVLAAEGGALA